MLHSKKKIKMKADQREYTPHGNIFSKHSHATIALAQAKNACAKTKTTHPKIQKGKIMRTVLFAYYLNNERKHEALYTEQRLDFMRSYKIRKRRKTVSDVEGCLV